MSNLFQQLFKLSHKTKDGLTQVQREAILDLLFYAMFADNNVALKESELISDTVEQFNWDPKMPYETYSARSISHVRAVKESPEARADFLAAVAKRLGTKEARSRALALCRKLFQADGTVADKEFELLRDLQKSLG